jgi:cytochrome c-type biogenesis protein CcmH/NrfG
LGQIGLLLRLYISPLKTFSCILDEGSLIFAAIAALAVILGLQVPRVAEYQRLRYQQIMQRITARKQALAAEHAKSAKQQPAESSDAENGEDDEAYNGLAETMTMIGGMRHENPVAVFIGQTPTYVTPLAALAICFVPMTILVLTFWDNLGGFSTILFRDYMALLVCCLLAWTAPYLLVTLANTALGAARSPLYSHPAFWWAAQVYFLALAALAVRTLTGTKFVHAAGASAGGWVAGVGGIWVYGTFGNVSGYLASPFVLYYLYRGLSPQLSGLGTGLTSRQRLKRGLENATLNPRDADAHFQLGLIYMQRRQHESAIERFRKAIEVDPSEPDAHYQLGRIAREQGRYSEAVAHCREAARLDDKHSSSEVWREIGIASFLGDNGDEARQVLERYLERRPYDPEGLCWYGRVLAKLGLHDQARSAFEQAVESVRTMPSARKRQVRCWEAEARREMKRLPAGATVTA